MDKVKLIEDCLTSKLMNGKREETVEDIKRIGVTSKEVSEMPPLFENKSINNKLSQILANLESRKPYGDEIDDLQKALTMASSAFSSVGLETDEEDGAGDTPEKSEDSNDNDKTVEGEDNIVAPQPSTLGEGMDSENLIVNFSQKIDTMISEKMTKMDESIQRMDALIEHFSSVLQIAGVIPEVDTIEAPSFDDVMKKVKAGDPLDAIEIEVIESVRSIADDGPVDEHDFDD
jgi:hypothetical protein